MPKANRKNLFLDKPSMHEKYPVSVMDQISSWMKDMKLIEENILRRYVREILIENVIPSQQTMKDLSDYAIGNSIDISKALKNPANVTLRQVVFDILEISYADDPIEGASFYESPDDLMSHHMNAFHAYDLTGDGLPNVIFSGWKSRKSSYNMIKAVQSGTDGKPESVAFYKKELVRRTIDGEAFHEVSGAPAAILMKAGLVPWDGETIRKYFPKPKRTHIGKHPNPSSRDARNAEKYGRGTGKYDQWQGRALMGQGEIVKLFFGKIPS